MRERNELAANAQGFGAQAKVRGCGEAVAF
jgi:hypothetical protein